MLHKVEWTGKKVEEFWNNIDYLISNGERVNDYFSLGGGDEFLYAINKKINLKDKKILDYGCGVGVLMEKILLNYHPRLVCGCDTSEESVELATKRCEGYSEYGRAIKIGESAIPLDDETFDVIIVTEVVEHVTDKALEFLLTEVRRLLKKDGVVVISTPNDENLKASIVVCPDCGCYFHKVQHVRSWNERTLTEYLNNYGFKQYKIIKTTLNSRKSAIRKLYSAFYNSAAKILGKKHRNLIYIGGKNSECW